MPIDPSPSSSNSTSRFTIGFLVLSYRWYSFTDPIQVHCCCLLPSVQTFFPYWSPHGNSDTPSNSMIYLISVIKSNHDDSWQLIKRLRKAFQANITSIDTSLQNLSDTVTVPEAKSHNNTNLQTSWVQTHDWMSADVTFEIVDITKGAQIFWFILTCLPYSSTIMTAMENIMDIKSPEEINVLLNTRVQVGQSYFNTITNLDRDSGCLFDYILPTSCNAFFAELREENLWSSTSLPTQAQI